MKKHVILLILTALGFQTIAQKPLAPDVPYRQPVSVKYQLSGDLQGATLKKVVVDYNDIIYLLTDKGLYRDYYEDQISKDLFYRLLSDKIPADITVQEEWGYLYYLYDDEFLTNAHAGVIYKHIPKGKYHKILVNRDDKILLFGDKKASTWQRTEKIAEFSLPKGKLIDAQVFDKKFYYLTPEALYRLDSEKWSKIHESANLTAMTFRPNEVVLGASDGYYVIDIYTGQKIMEKNNKLPVPAITGLLQSGSELWFASADGAFLKEPGRFRYFAGRRWLNENRVIDLAADSKGNIVLLTPTGLNKIKYVTTTLARKAEKIQNDIRRYHMRFGFVAEADYKVPGDMRTATLLDHDNDGLWTSFYLTSQAFRYAVTGEAVARRYAWESFETYERLLSINPLKGFPSRTFERHGIIKNHPKWRQAPEKEWDWKGHTSSDEYIAYLFVASTMDMFVARTPEEKKRIANYVDAIMTHIIENDYYFVDIDGKPTKWGKWNPKYVNNVIGDRKLNSAHLIAGLQLAYKLTGKEIFKSEAFRVMKEWGYFDNIMTPLDSIIAREKRIGETWNHSDDEMYFPTYWVLYHYAFNDTLKDNYVKIIREHWQKELPERSALWNLFAYGTTGDIDLESTLWHLREFNIDLDRYSVKNSHRKDLEMLPPNVRQQTTAKVLYPGERRMHRHNANPFDLDGGERKMKRLAGDEYLLPYWMARYLKVID